MSMKMMFFVFLNMVSSEVVEQELYLGSVDPLSSKLIRLASDEKVLNHEIHEDVYVSRM